MSVSRQLSSQVAAALLAKLPAELTSRQAQIVDTPKRQCPGFAVMRKLVFGFRSILRGGKVTTLRCWMEEARKRAIHSLVRFVRTLKQDLSAVELAVSEPWSNGPVKGQLNRLKMPKGVATGTGQRASRAGKDAICINPSRQLCNSLRFRPLRDQPIAPESCRSSFVTVEASQRRRVGSCFPANKRNHRQTFLRHLGRRRGFSPRSSAL